MTANDYGYEPAVKQSHGIEIIREEIEDQPQAIILHLAGYLDIYNATYFKREIESLIASGYVNLILDLLDLTDISSIGIGNFIHLRKLAKSRQGEIVVVHPRRKVLEIFDLLGFSPYLNIRDSMEEALRYFAPDPNATLFPKTESCPICSRRLKFPSEGRFRCPQCKTPFIVNQAAEIRID